MESSKENTTFQRRGHKRKNKFLQNARSYGKKGSFGRGSHLTEDVYTYFVTILEKYKEGFDDQDVDKESFTNTFFEHTIDNEVHYSRNQIGCRVIETLLPFANSDVINRFTKAFSDDLRPLLSDRFASFVLQQLLKITAFKGVDYIKSESDANLSEAQKHTEICYKYTLKISKFLLNNLEDYVWDDFGNRIIRTVVESLSGLEHINDNKQKMGNNRPKQESESRHDRIELESLPKEYIEVAKEYAERLMKWPQFGELPYNTLTSGLLQSLVIALHKIDKKLLKHMQKEILERSFVGESTSNEVNNEKKYSEMENITNEELTIQKLPPVFNSVSAIHLLETIILTSKSKIYTQIYAKLFTNRLAVLSKQGLTNHSVQKLLLKCREKTEFEAIFEDLASEMEDILREGFTGIIYELVQACQRLNTKQGAFIENLMKALHCYEPHEKQLQIVPATLFLLPLEHLEAKLENSPNWVISQHGSRIVQAMLEFNKPIKIVNSILNMSTEDLKKVFCDTKGSFIMNAYMNNIYVGEKSREKLIRKLQGVYQDLALSKFGSRSLEVVWNVAEMKHKMHIMEELSHRDGTLNGTEFGKIIASKLKVTLFKRNKDQWKQTLNKENKTMELFADILK